MNLINFTLCYSWVDYKALISVCLVGTFTTDDIGPELPLKSISETPQEEDGKHDRIVDQYTLVYSTHIRYEHHKIIENIYFEIGCLTRLSKMWLCRKRQGK